MDRKFSQLPTVSPENISGDDLVVILTANGENATATISTIAQGLSENEVTKESLGLGNVDNTADAHKPVSQAQQNALDLKADKTELEGLATNGQLESLASQTSLALGTKASTEELNAGLAQVNQRIDNLSPGEGGGVSEARVNEIVEAAIEPLATTVALNEGLAGKADTSALDGLASQTYVDEAIAAIPPGGDGVSQEQVDQSISTAIAPLATTEALTEGLATKANVGDLEGLATNESVAQAVNGLATQTYVDEAIAAIPPGGDGVSQEQVDQSIATAIQPLATTDALTQGLAGKADSTALNNYVTASQFTEDMALKADASALEGLTTDAEFQQLSELVGSKADASMLDAYATSQALTDGLATKANVGDLEGLATSESVAQAVTGLASESYVNQKLSDLVGEAPEAMDTLKEISAALADNADFAGTMTQQLALKADKTELVPFALKTEVTSEIEAAVAGTIHLASQATEGQVPVFVGDEWISTDKKKLKLFWVDSANNVVFRNGTYDFPFANIQDAVNAAAASAVGVVIMVVGGGTYAGFTINGLLNLHVQGYGTNDSHQTKVIGKITITGANTTRLKFKDLQVQAAAVGELALEVQGGAGRHYFENVTIEYASGGNVSQPLVEFNGSYANWYDLFNCSWNGQVKFAGTPNANAAFYVRSGNGGNMNIVQEAPVNIFLTNCTRMGYVKHIGGVLAMHNVIAWTGLAGNAIDSTSDTGELRIGFSDFSKAAGGFVKINKTGQAGYRLVFTNHDVANDVLVGTKMNDGGSVDTLADVLKAVRPVITVAATEFGEGGGIVRLSFETTNGYSMSAVALNLRYKKTADANWTDIAPQAFSDGLLQYDFVVQQIDDGVDYQIQGYLTDSNAPNVQVYSPVATFNHPAG
jgi:hypothetical protein